MTNTLKKGFTLIEVMIVLGIVAILAALAVPAFQDALRKSRRSDAMNTIMDIQLAQERWRASDTDYGTLVEMGFTNPQVSPDGHYSVRLSSVTATGYIITATAQAPQDQDYCGNFILTNAAGVLTKTTSKGVADLCWRK